MKTLLFFIFSLYFTHSSLYFEYIHNDNDIISIISNIYSIPKEYPLKRAFFWYF
ncbi:MAG: hypothetical protein HPY66_3547 [Firmicutes bacterium]|nr:hypothetical protein [Bacillota bacterium]